MAKKVTPKKENLKNEPLEVEVIIPEEVLKKEKHFKDVYIDGKLTYNFGNELPENLKTEISDIIKSSKVDEIVLFNPLLVALEKLEEIKEYKWDPENAKESEREFIDSNKLIGSFNTSIKDVTTEMRKDADAYIKKVRSIADFFTTESKTTRNILEDNFKGLLEEREKKKKEAEDKKNKAIIEQNAQLVKENEEQALKLKNQKKESKRLTVVGEIGKITFSATSGVSVLNLDGLEKLKKETTEKSFDNLLSKEEIEENGFSEDDIFELTNEFNNAISTSLKALNIAIDNLNKTAENQELKTENEVMKAKQPETLLSGDDDVPFAPASPNAISDDARLFNDEDKMKLLASTMESFNSQILYYEEEIKKIKFEDAGLQKVQSIISDKSFPQIKEWGQKLVEWTNTKKDTYINFLQTQN